jgi:ADP-glucose pyrophosphorylase
MILKIYGGLFDLDNKLKRKNELENIINDPMFWNSNNREEILKENNVINNSKIGKNACISGSVVESSIIASNVYVSSFCEIHNGLIGDFSTIGAGSKICNYKIPNNSKIRANSVLGEEDDSSGRIG